MTTLLIDTYTRVSSFSINDRTKIDTTNRATVTITRSLVSSSLLLWIIIITLLLCVGGGAAYYFMVIAPAAM